MLVHTYNSQKKQESEDENGYDGYDTRSTLVNIPKFPNDSIAYNKWKQILRMEGDPFPSSRICSCHFKDGLKENGPELLIDIHEPVFIKHHLTPEKKKRKHKIKTTSTKRLKFTKQDDSTEAPFLNLEPSTSKGTGHSLSSVCVEEETVDPFLHSESSTSKEIEHSSSVNIKSEERPSSSASFLSSTMIEAELILVTNKLQEAKKKIKELSIKYCFENMSDKSVAFYTGIPNREIYLVLFNRLKNIKVIYEQKWNVQNISKIDQLLITLMKLRQNFPYQHLRNLFDCSKSTLTNIIRTWLGILHYILIKKYLNTIPTMKKMKSCLPSSFSNFTNSRVILDCTEIYTSVSPQTMDIQRSTYSSFKHRNTWKGLVAVAPNGAVVFLSSLYPNSTSDKNIVQDCGILNQLTPGDLVLADKGFLIRDILPPGVHLNTPPFLSTLQFTQERVYQTQQIARARIHVERAIGRMKNYKILDFIPYSLLPLGTQIFQVVGGLTNLQYTIT